jgi:EmrB/QacA subfamily drug resistance transporter
MPTTFSPQARNVALVVAASFFIQILDGVIIVTALPQMAADFRVDTLQMSIGVTIYMLASAIFIPAAGWLSDRFGARRIFMAAMALFTLASLACGAAEDLTQFSIARFVQGIGGAILLPVGRVLVLRNATKAEIVPAIGLTVWPALFAPVLGPAIGGFFTTYVSWHWNFWVNIPLGIIGLLLTYRVIPADGDRIDRPFDWIGFLLSGVSLATLLYGFDTLANGAMEPLVAALLIAVGLMAGTLAVLWLRRSAHPLLDLSPLRIKTFAAAEALAGAALRLSINATPFLLPLMFQVAFGLDPLQSGGLVMAYFLGNLCMKAITTPTLRRFGFRNILSVNGTLSGLFIAACGLLAPDTPYPLLIGILVVAGMTRSMQFTALATLAFADVEPEHRSSASTLSSMFQQITSVFGIALCIGLLGLAQLFHTGSPLGLLDFRFAFFAIGAITVAASLQLLTLQREAGAEVSGHRQA